MKRYKSYVSNIFRQVWLLVFMVLNTSSYAQTIDIRSQKLSLIEHSKVYFDENNMSLKQIVQNDLFRSFLKSNIDIATDRKAIWVQLDFSNPTEQKVSKIILFSSPFLEHIHIYNKAQILVKKIGQAHIIKEHTTLLHYFELTLLPHENRTYYFKIYSQYSPVNFMMYLENKKVYIKENSISQAVDLFLIGFIAALMLYSLIISLYLKDKSYLYYALYLFGLLYYQFTYVGLTSVYMPLEFVAFDLDITIVRIHLLLMATALFAISFLNIKRYPKLYKIYILFFVLFFVGMVFFHAPNGIGMPIVIIIALLISLYNFSVAVYVLNKGYRQARLYVVGFGVVLIIHLIVISDSLGLSNIMNTYPNLLL